MIVAVHVRTHPHACTHILGWGVRQHASLQGLWNWCGGGGEGSGGAGAGIGVGGGGGGAERDS